MDSAFKIPRTLLACAGLLALTACGDSTETTERNVSAADPNLNAGATATEVIDDPSPGTEGTVFVEGNPNPLPPPDPLVAGNDNSVADATGNNQLQTGRQGQEQVAQTAMASMQPVNDSQVSGNITFMQQSGGVAIDAQLSGLQPGMHGFHVHEFGDCSAPDGSSAGEHWNPEDREHGNPEGNPGERHLGDLGNIEVTQNGEVVYDRVDSVISLTGPNSIVGKAIVVHRMADDLVSQPSGNSGDPVACGVIEGGSQLTQDQPGGPDNA